jgi:hypothetical protein
MYRIAQFAQPLYWTQVRLLRRDVRVQYYGRTHEVFRFHEPLEQTPPLLRIIGVCDYHDRSSHDVKLERDLQLLQLDLKDNPNDGRASFYVGNTLAQLGRTREARDAWLHASKLPTPEATEMGALWYAARMLLWLGDTAGFEAEMEAVFAAYPRPGIACELATNYKERGQSDKCLAFCRQGIALHERQRRTVDSDGAGFVDMDAIVAMQRMLDAL